MTITNDITNYRDFWPYYLREHANPRTRSIHIFGTWIAVALLAASALTANPWLLLPAPIAGYGPAWYAHLAIEKNRPTTFRFPLWSLYSDFRMATLSLVGRLPQELERAGVPSTHPRRS
jgi:hypothetical protein